MINVLKLNSRTVSKYRDMTDEDYACYLIEKSQRTKIMDEYRCFVLERLVAYPKISSAIIYDNLH